MKKMFVLALAAALTPSLGSAKGNFPMAGCGLGYMAFGYQQNSKVYQVLSATVNDIVSPKTFAITSGTSGCTEDGTLKLARQVEVYAEVNLDGLRREIATGDGEIVATFASLLGASEAKRPRWVKFFQTHYPALFPSPDTSSAEMLQNLDRVLAANPGVLS